MENEKNEKMDRERIELVVHDRGGRPPFEAPNEVYFLTFPPQQDNRASRAVAAVVAAAHANPDYAIELPKSRATTAVTKDGKGMVAVWSDASWALVSQTKEYLQVLKDAISPGQSETPNLDDLPPEAAALWEDIFRMAEAAMLKGLAADIEGAKELQ